MPRILKLIFGMSLVTQVSLAQPPPGPAIPPGPTATPPGAQMPSQPPVNPPPPQVDISVPQRSTLSPQDMLNQAREYRGRMNEALTRLQGLVEAARKAKDIIRLNCLTDKLVQLRANMNVADQAIQSLQDAMARRDEGASVHEYTRVTIVNQKVQVLAAEGEACVGEDLNFVGATRVDVDAPNLPDPQPPGTVVPDFRPPFRPDVASPVR